MVSPVLRSRFALASRLRAVFTAFAVNLAFLLAFLVAPLAISSPSYAAKGVVAGSEMTGFGRVVFAFDREVGAKVRTQNSVLVVEFDQAVTVDLDKLSAQLPGYISVARLDPDGKSLRFGMTERFKADLKPAGEKVYIDILSMRWQGLPPSLPVEVVQDLVKRARVAEDQLRRIERDRERRVMRDLDLRVGSTPQFKRAIFTMPKVVPVDFDDRDGVLSLTFDANFNMTPELIRSRLAGLVQDVDVEPSDTSLKITMRALDGIKVRGFREDDSFTLDFSRGDGQPIDTLDMPAQKAADTAKPPVAPGKPSPAPAVISPPAKGGKPVVEAPVDAGGATPKTTMIKGVNEPDPPIDASFEAGRDSAGFALRISNLRKSPIAIVPRGNGVLIAIETPESPGVPTIPAELKPNIEGVTVSRIKGGVLFHVMPRQAGAFWLARNGDDFILQRGAADVAADAHMGAGIPLKRAFDAIGKESLEAMVGEVGTLMMIDDPHSGQRLAIIPVPDALYASAKAQAFAEFMIEKTLSGLAILPLDEAVTIKRQPKSVLIGHDIKLNLSALPPEEVAEARLSKALLLDPASWEQNTKGVYRLSERDLIRAAAESPRVTRSDARMRLARFYLANGNYPEATGVLDVLAADDQSAAGTKTVLFHRAFAAAMMGRNVEAGRLLAEPALAMEAEQKLLSGIVDAKSMRYPQAVANLKNASSELDRYPDKLQAEIRRLAIEAAIEAADPLYGREQLLAYEQLNASYRNLHLQQLLAGRLAEMQGRFGDAFAAFSLAVQSSDRRIEAEARFGKASAGLADGKVTPDDARAEFETLTAIWRRSEVEVKSLARLGETYAAEGRWREAFQASQRASALMPDHPVARRMEEAMGRRFEALFLDNEADKLAKVEALALYSEFRQLVPPGRRGDEIARRLADRLHDLDLVTEATDILEHQVRKRLDGVARSSVATRLALMYLQSRQPVKALTILRDTRLSSLPHDLRRARNLLEARALGDVFRTELAIEVLANEKGEDADRLRADIYWKGKKWREAGESYERVLGESWQNADALSDMQRLDALRSGLAYVLGEEKLSLDRLRGKFLTKMAKTEDSGAFNLITLDNFSKPQAFRDVARTVVNADTMVDFLASYRKRYPETGGNARPVRSAGDNKQSAANQPLPNG